MDSPSRESSINRLVFKLTFPLSAGEESSIVFCFESKDEIEPVMLANGAPIYRPGKSALFDQVAVSKTA